MAINYSVVLPVHNEAQTLVAAVAKVRESLAGLDAEIIIAEDGSDDGTCELALKLAKKYAGMRVLHSARKLGRGGALKKAFEQARGKIVAYLDSDLSTPPRFLPRLFKAVEECGIATGSRYAAGSVVERDFSRKVHSIAYNFLVRLVLGSAVADHQCGFKAFRKESIAELNALARSNDWFWDTEVLVLAQKAGYCVKEIPVQWEERSQGRSKVNLLRDSLEMLSSILSMRLRLWKRGILY